MAARILVTVEHPEGTGGVVREDGHAWLSLRVPQAVTRLDDGRPAVIGLEDRTLQGGLLPAGAVAAWVTDDRGERRPAATGDGAWAIVLDQPIDGALSPVCFRDGAAALVVPALPATWARAPVPDADEPCPACDSVGGWDEVVANDDSRGTRGADGRPCPFAVCRACGHEHGVGVFYAALAEEEPGAEELARFRREAEAHLRLEARMAFADLTFAVFVARGRRGRIGGWGSSDLVLTSVAVEHGAAAGEDGPWLRVSTERERHLHESEAAIARSALRPLLQEGRLGAWPQRSSAGLAIWLDGVERAARRRVARTGVERRTMLVDGEALVFATVTCGAHWAAAGRRGDLRLLVTAHRVEPEDVDLVSVTDPLTALDSM